MNVLRLSVAALGLALFASASTARAEIKPIQMPRMPQMPTIQRPQLPTIARPELPKIEPIARPAAKTPTSTAPAPATNPRAGGHWVAGLDGVKVSMPRGTRWVQGLDGRVVPLARGQRWQQGLDGHIKVLPAKR